MRQIDRYELEEYETNYDSITEILQIRFLSEQGKFYSDVLTQLQKIFKNIKTLDLFDVQSEDLKDRQDLMGKLHFPKLQSLKTN